MRRTPQTYKVTVQSRTLAKDSGGSSDKTWTTFSQPYMSITFPKSKEDDEGGRSVLTQEALFEAGYDSDTKNITAAMRFVHEGDTYLIKGIRKYGRNNAILFTTILKNG